jgi:hypothetical protein
MTIQVWTVTSDDDNGMVTNVHAREHDAYVDLAGRMIGCDEEETQKMEAFLAAGDYDGLDAFVHEALTGPLDTYSVEPHTLTVLLQQCQGGGQA